MTKPQLFMFHFAGGNSYSFKFMEQYLQDFKIETIELPGRGSRSGEDLVKDFVIAAQDLYMQVKKKLNSNNFAFFGHSMGALLAFKVANLLEKDNLKPVCLILTGNPGPNIKINERRYKMNNVDFIATVKKLGGLPKEFLESQELLDYFIPILKADFEVAEENNLGHESRVNVPIYALMGSEEKYSDRLSNWSEYTTASFNYELLSGNHFFIFDCPEKISSVISSFYSKHLTTNDCVNTREAY